MAARATGFTKLLLASSITGKNNAAETAATTERWANREEKDNMSAIIEGCAAHGIPPLAKDWCRLATRRFRMAQLELFCLQSGLGPGNAVEPPLLALPEPAPRQIPKRFGRTPRQGPAATDCN